MRFSQLLHKDTCTYTFLLGCERTRHAVLIDPVDELVATHLDALKDRGLQLELTLETHTHADHVTGAGLLRQRVGCRVGVPDPEAVGADVLVRDGDRLLVGELCIQVLATPGHTGSCVSYLVGDRVFTGDALRIGTCGRTDFQEGDAGRLYDSIMKKLYTLPPDTLLYPGHDYKKLRVSSIQQEKETNPRINAETRRGDFVAYMDSLVLDPPRHMSRAVPANRRCGDDVPADLVGAHSSAEDWEI